MARMRSVENRRDRMDLASEAGYSKVSLGSVLTGVVVAYGAFAILAAISGGILSALGVDVGALSDNDWRRLGMASGVAMGLSLLLSYFYGGYVAGRMSRRGGAFNGLLVFVLGILVAVGVAAAVGTQAGSDGLVDNLRSLGVPTSGEDYRALGTFAGLGGLVAMLVGSVLGGIAGERWHGKLMARALDPTVGPAAAAGLESVTAPDDRPVAVRGGGRHFADGDANGSDDPEATRRDIASRPEPAADRTPAGVTATDADPEHTRTMH